MATSPAGGGSGPATGGTPSSSIALAAASATKSYPLKSITEIVVPAYKFEHVHLLELRFSDSGSYSTRGEVLNQFKLRSHDEMQLVLALLVCLLR